MRRALFILVLLAPSVAFAAPRHGKRTSPKAPEKKNPAPAPTPSEKSKAPPAARGTSQGGYDLKVTGHFTGTGTATVTDKVSLSATIKRADGTTGTLTATDLNLTKGYFKGDGTIMGVPCTVEGRVDLPSAEDNEETDQQATTGRITGTFKDANGNVGRIVAVENQPTAAGDDDKTKSK